MKIEREKLGTKIGITQKQWRELKPERRIEREEEERLREKEAGL